MASKDISLLSTEIEAFGFRKTTKTVRTPPSSPLPTPPTPSVASTSGTQMDKNQNKQTTKPLNSAGPGQHCNPGSPDDSLRPNKTKQTATQVESEIHTDFKKPVRTHRAPAKQAHNPTYASKVKNDCTEVKLSNRYKLQQEHRKLDPNASMLDESDLDKTNYETDCAMESDNEVEAERVGAVHGQHQRTSSVKRTNTPPLHITVDEYDTDPRTKKPNLALFISGNPKSIITYCSKPGIHLEKEIIELIGKPTNIYYNKKDDYVKLVCSNEKQKEQALKLKLIGKLPVTITLPRSQTREVLFKYTIEVPIHIKDEEILAKTQATELKRILTRKDGNLIPTNSVVLFFKSATSVEDVSFDGTPTEIKPFIPLPIRCDNCQKYGHHKKSCKSRKPTCSHCGDSHKYDSCQSRIRGEQAQCCNCGGGHSSAYKQCPRYTELKRALELRAISKIPLKKALKEVKPKRNQTLNQSTNVGHHVNQTKNNSKMVDPTLDKFSNTTVNKSNRNRTRNRSTRQQNENAKAIQAKPIPVDTPVVANNTPIEDIRAAINEALGPVKIELANIAQENANGRKQLDTDLANIQATLTTLKSENTQLIQELSTIKKQHETEIANLKAMLMTQNMAILNKDKVIKDIITDIVQEKAQNAFNLKNIGCSLFWVLINLGNLNVTNKMENTKYLNSITELLKQFGIEMVQTTPDANKTKSQLSPGAPKQGTSNSGAPSNTK